MNSLRVRAARQPTALLQRAIRTQRTYATSPPRQPSRVGTFYKSFSAPILKCFLGALFTYQLAYFGWMKLEAIEEAYDKSAEVRGLQQELREAVASRGKAGEGVVGKVEEVGERVVEGVKEGADEAAKATGAVGKVAKGGWWPW